MIRRILLLLSTIGLLLVVAPAVTTSAANFTNPLQSACDQAGAAAKTNPACTTNGSDPITGQNGILYKTSKILSLIAGMAAVIIIMIGGFMYITSGGDSNKANTAKTAITSAVVGLLVIILAQTFIAIIINLVQK